MTDCFDFNEIQVVKNAYRRFQLEFTASPQMIKERYIALIKKWHPDRWAHDEMKEQKANLLTQEINAAYQLIRFAPLLTYKEEPQNFSFEKHETQTRAYSCHSFHSSARHEKNRRRRHASAEEATAFRKRSAGQFRFFTGVAGSVLPLAMLRFAGVYGLPFVLCCTILPLLCGVNAWRKDMLDDDDGLF